MKIFNLVCLLLFLTLTSWNCQKDKDIITEGDTFADVIDAGGGFASVTESTDVVEMSEPQDTTIDGEAWRCTTTTYSATAKGGGDKGFPSFNPNASVIYPGSMLQGKSLKQATPDVIPVKRTGGTISIDVIDGSIQPSFTVDEVKKSTIATALNSIIANSSGVVPSNFIFNYESVQSREQMALALGVDVNTAFVDVESALSFSTDRYYNRILVRLEQSYYTMSFDIPTSLDELFAPEVKPEDLARYVGSDNPATYISDVTYGRIYYMLIESTASTTEMNAAVNASFQGVVNSVDVELEVERLKELNGLRIKVFALGGDAQKTITTIGETDLSRLVDLLAESGDITTGVPLSYVVRSIYNNQIVNVALATTYDVTQCDPVDTSLPNRIVWYSAESGVRTTNVGLGLPAVTGWEDQWADEDMTALPTIFPYAGWLLEDRVNGRGNYINFISGTSGNGPEGKLAFSGVRLRNTDYTIFVTMKNSTQPGSNKTLLFTWGNQGEAGQTLRLGLKGDNTVFASHGEGLQLESDTRGPTQYATKLFTFRFSQTEGMKIYVNGILTAEDASFTTPVASFNGAALGIADENGITVTTYPAALHLSEFKVVGAALNETVRAEEEERMMLQYGI